MQVNEKLYGRYMPTLRFWSRADIIVHEHIAAHGLTLHRRGRAVGKVTEYSYFIRMIAEKILVQYHASVVTLNKNDMLFQQGETAGTFFIVKSGKVKMSNYSDDGKEFVQGYFTDGQSFGEPPFFSHGPYPASAIAVEKTDVWRIPHDDFLQLLKNNFDIHLQLMQTLCSRLLYKSTMLSELAIEEAEHRLLTLIRYLVDHEIHYGKSNVKLPYTRQQLADMTGLRVETVIRSIKSLEQKRQLEIDTDGKIIWNQITK